jgi:dTDP-4-dehydrorhamnose 3,5-epimerase
MQIEDTAIADVKIVTPKRHCDERGFFSDVYKQSDWTAAGFSLRFVQDKLARVARSRVLDVAVDIRRSSPSCRSASLTAS